VSQRKVDYGLAATLVVGKPADGSSQMLGQLAELNRRGDSSLGFRARSSPAPGRGLIPPVYRRAPTDLNKRMGYEGIAKQNASGDGI
jgi:hypothetical protein